MLLLKHHQHPMESLNEAAAQDLLNVAQQRIAETKEFQRSGFHQLQKEGDLIERELEVFEDRMESAKLDDAAPQATRNAARLPQVIILKRGVAHVRSL
jgi:hypothetical protein